MVFRGRWTHYTSAGHEKINIILQICHFQWNRPLDIAAIISWVWLFCWYHMRGILTFAIHLWHKKTKLSKQLWVLYKSFRLGSPWEAWKVWHHCLALWWSHERAVCPGSHLSWLPWWTPRGWGDHYSRCPAPGTWGLHAALLFGRSRPGQRLVHRWPAKRKEHLISSWLVWYWWNFWVKWLLQCYSYRSINCLFISFPIDFVTMSHSRATV